MKPRSAGVKLVYNGTDITADIAADIESISYEGNAADDSDSVNVTINAMADKWLNDWMPEKGTSLDPTILVYNWPEEGQGGEMNNGVMTVDDICECLKVLYSTRAGELGLDRDFGISMDAIDKPLSVAKAMIAAEIVRKTKKYEPRVEVARVEWDDAKAGEGILIPKVVLQVV